MTESSDYYGLLGVARSATPDEIAAAYRRLARTHHPDVSDAPGAADRMVAINRAYRVLSDPTRRVSYDAMLHGLPATAWRVTPAAEDRPPPAGPGTSSSTTRLVGAGFLGVLLAFIAVACVLSAQIPTTTRPDGFLVLPRATATALALAGLPSAQRTATASASKPVTVAGAVPGVLRDHPALRQFPGPVLVPPTSLAPFAAFARDAPNVSSSVCDGSVACVPRYTVEYGTPTAGGQISGFGGRGIFDADVSAATTCGGNEPVCVASGGVGRPHVQYVRDLQVLSRFAAVARHQDCCPGPFWVITWYDASADSTYRLQLSGTAAVLDPNAPSPRLEDQAAALVTIASGLVALR